MANNVVKQIDSTNQTARLAQWFCRYSPKRLLVIDLHQQQVIAADPDSLMAAQLEARHFPISLHEFVSDAAITLINSETSNEHVSMPFRLQSFEVERPATWRYHCLLSGELGVLYQPSGISDSDRAAPKIEPTEKDELTKLNARGSLFPSLELALERWKSSGVGFAVLFLDFDHFKQINDQFGHLAGDEVLRRAAEGILHAIRPGDVAVRYGGDEFVIVIGGLHSPSEALIVARRVAAAHADRIVWNSLAIPYTVSIGVAYSKVEDTVAKEILERADQAMYRAKNRGRCGEIELD